MTAVASQETIDFLTNFLDFWFKVTDIAFGSSFHLSGLYHVRREVLQLTENLLPTEASRKVKMKLIHRSTSSSHLRRRTTDLSPTSSSVRRDSEGGMPKKKRLSIFSGRPPSPSLSSLDSSPLSVRGNVSCGQELSPSLSGSSDAITFPSSPSNSPPPSPSLRSSIHLSSSFTLPSSSGSLSHRKSYSPSSPSNSSPTKPSTTQSNTGSLFSAKKKLFARDTDVLHILDFPERDVASELYEMSFAHYSKLTALDLLKCAWMKESRFSYPFLTHPPLTHPSTPTKSKKKKN